jgi:hypothetical protein
MFIALFPCIADMTTSDDTLVADTAVLDEGLQKVILLLCLDKYDEGLLFLERQLNLDLCVPGPFHCSCR